MAFVDDIKNFYTAAAFQGMEGPYKRGYIQAAANGLLNPDQAAWGAATMPTWNPADITNFQTALHDAFRNLTQANQFQATTINSDVRAFIAKWGNVPLTPANFEEVLKAFRDNLDKLDVILSNMPYPNQTYEYAVAIYNSLNAVNYKDGKNKVGAVYVDKKNAFGRASDKIKQISDDHFGKYLSRGKREKMPPTARATFDAIGEFNIKPQQGLDGLLANADKINSRLPGVAAGEFGTFIKALKPLSDKTQFKKALKSGKAMRGLVEDLADYVAENPKAEAAITNMLFILNALSYEWYSSSKRDALRKIDYNLLKGTSIEGTLNKMTNGNFSKIFAGTIKYSVMGVYNIANVAKNKLRGMHSEFGPATKQTRAIVQARYFVSRSPLDLAGHRAVADAARTAYEAAAKSGKRGANKLKLEWQKLELNVQAKETMDDRASATPKHETALDRKMRIMAHWDFIHSGKANEIGLGSHRRAEKGYYDASGGTSKYQTQISQHLNRWNGGMAA